MEPVAVVDYHTAGEPFRIVVEGAPSLVGSTVLERRADALEQHDEIRRLVINEPRGHADQYGCFVVPPDDDGAVFGVVFFHKDGYSTACGHGTIAAATWAFESGLVEGTEGVNHIAIDVPSGRVQAEVEIAEGRVRSTTFVNVPSFVTARHITVEIERSTVPVAISYGGAFYVSIDVADIGFPVVKENLERFVGFGREVKRQLAAHPATVHSDPRLSGVYGVIFHEHIGHHHQRNVTVFADGEVDRSPCGSGTSARLALLHANGDIAAGETLTHDSIVGTRFYGQVSEVVAVDDRPAVITRVTGSAYKTGSAHFSLDPDDPIGLGFQLR